MSYTLMGGTGDPAGTAAAAVAAHEADTTNVHGITNTALLETTAGAQSKADAAQAAAIAASAQRGSNLSDLASASTARTNLGLGGSATRAVGAGSGQVLSADTVDAKGDLFVATADNTVTRLAVGADGQIPVADSTQTSGVRWSAFLHSRGDPLTAGGEAVCDRRIIAATGTALGSGNLQLTYFTAQVAETINNLVLYTASTAAATVTLIRYGVYSVAANGDLTLVASTANDTSLLAVANTRYLKALSSSWSKLAGQRYAAGLLTVSTTSPSMVAVNAQSAAIFDAVFAQEPRLFGVVTSQSDLPSTVANASVTSSRRAPYAEMLP
jgi:hypothetical protein